MKDIIFFSLGLLLSGFLATTSAKAVNRRGFTDHPFTQTLFMFLGEILLLFFIGRKPLINFISEQNRPPLSMFAILAALDLIGSTFTYAGINKCDASTYMMLRASIIPLTGIISALYKRKIPPRNQFIGIIIVVSALILVSLGSRDNAVESNQDNIDNNNNNNTSLLSMMLRSDGDSNTQHQDSTTTTTTDDVTMGVLYIVFAQLLIAIMMVGEEILYAQHENLTPLFVVGFEGVFGVFTMMPCILILTSSIPTSGSTDAAVAAGQPQKKIDSFPDAVHEMSQDWRIFVLLMTNMFAVAGLNFFGSSVTRSLTAAHRTVIDSVRIILVWGFSLAAKWETHVSPFQICGFFILLFGIGIFNGLICSSSTTKISSSNSSTDLLLDEQQHSANEFEENSQLERPLII
jgi:drug/metabolite transporter (DMT)-like permease